MELFVYGTLTFEPVLEVLLGRVPHRHQSAINGWRAALLRTRPYPALVPAIGVVTGYLLTDLSSMERRILHAYENGAMYQPMEVRLVGAGIAEAYVCSDPSAVRNENWDVDWFRIHELEHFLVRLLAWRDKLEIAS